MSSTIERLSFGGILDRSFELLKEVFVPVVSAFALLSAPWSLFPLWLSDIQGDIQDLDDLLSVGTLLPIGIGIVVVVGLGPWLQLAVNLLVVERYLSRSITFKQALKRVSPLYVPYLGTSFLVMLFILGGMLLFIVPGLYLAVCYIFVGAVVALEEQFGKRALKRSKQLIEGYWWRSFGLLLCIGLVNYVVDTVFEAVFESIPVVRALLSLVAQAIGSAMQVVILMVLYIDLRCRKEDLDLQLMAKELRQSRASGAPPAI